MRLGIYITTVFFFVSGVVFAQEDVTFEAKVSKERLGINEVLRVEFSMNKDGDNFTPPNFKNFRVLMGPMQSISNTWVNGKRSFSKTYSYSLAPTARGKFTIKQATVEIDGKTYKTLPVTVEITAAVDNPNAEKTPESIAEDKIHLVAEVSKSNLYLNEAFSVVYKLYVSPDISVSNYTLLDSPKYNNFWSQDIEVKRWGKATNGNYKGKPYRYVILKQVVLYPQKTGKLQIEPLSLDVTVEVPTNRRDFFGSRIYTQTHKTVAAGSRTIKVKPLPESEKPADFTGAVGDFDFNIVASKTDLKATESLTLKVAVNGKGNLKLFDLPKLNLPSSLEVYEPEFDERVATSLSGMRGKVADNYTVVPQYRGKYPIPGISFSYFDPEAGQYKTITSQEILINVFEGPTNAEENSALLPGKNYRQPVVALGSQFRFLKLNANLQAKEKLAFFGSRTFYMLLLLPLLLIPVFVLIFRKRKTEKDAESDRVRTANKLAKKYLLEAKKALDKKEAFYEAMERALHNYLKAKLKIETSEFSKDKISDLLTSRNVDTETVNTFIGLLNSCELARYTPSNDVTIQQDYNKAVDVISQIDKQITL